MDAIETEALTRTFGTRTAVDTLSLSIPAGTVFGFLGPNGAGKTTTVRMLSALIAPTSGRARVAGHTLGRDDQTIRRSIGILTETPGLYDRLTARQNLVFFARLYDVDAGRAVAQSERYLRRLDLWERRDEVVGGFSKGMRQKLAIVRALMHEPAVIFLDEPTSGLDPQAARTVLDFVKSLRAEGRTIFLTTHNLPEVDELCDLVGVFLTRLLRVDPPERLRAGLFGRGVEVRLAGDSKPFEKSARALPFVRQVIANHESLSVGLDDPDRQGPVLVQELIKAGAQIRSVEQINHSMEDVYMELIGNTQEQVDR